MSHHETKAMNLPEEPFSIDKVEKQLKEMKEFSRLLVILSVAFITISFSLHDFKGDIFSLYMLVVVVQLFALFFGVRFHRTHLFMFIHINSWESCETPEEEEDFRKEMKQYIDEAFTLCYRQDVSFFISFVILLFALMPWENLVSFAWQSLPFITK